VTGTGSPAPAAPARSASLDAFRGITIAGMILVNNPGSWAHVYPPLRHAEWHGWTPTDLIFPFFLFIVGVAIQYALVPRIERGVPRRELFGKILRRSVIIIGLGLFLAGFPRFDLTQIRIPGVLQRIGVVYLCASLVALRWGVRGQAITAAVLLFLYWGLLTLVPAPGGFAGDLTPEGNLGAYVDRLLFGDHLWRDAWDPEGLLSTLPAVATALFGSVTGHFMRATEPREFTGWCFVAGWLAIVGGLVWGWAFPINKNLWTSSYVVFTAGAALQFLGVCYWLIDIQGRRGWARPAIVFGRNAIAVFVGSGLLVKILLRVRLPAGEGTEVSAYAWIYRELFVPWAGTLNGSLAFALANVLLWYGVAELLYRRRIFIKI
jgi:predicted acyltransferase